ncbi:hypothetical protein FS749_000887 [Ceratobasidium sp. UAMH 11750]|nr:hypothetical protein FS749_000887 [Ceratobasidium sp. UAMH 11750]
MATPRMINDVLEICIEAGINVSGQTVNTHLKDDGDSDNEDEGEICEPRDTPEAQPKKAKAKKCYAMTVKMAEYLVTKGCLIDVLDRAFEIRRTSRVTRLEAAERSVKHEETELDIKMHDPETELKRTTRVKPENERAPKAIAFIKTRLLEWRGQEYQKLVVDFDIPIEAFMADKVVQRWKTKVLESVRAIEQDLNTQREQEEADKRKAAEAKKQANEEACKKEQEERARQREFAQQQKAHKEQPPSSSTQVPKASTSTDTNQPLAVENLDARLAHGQPVYKAQIAVPRRHVPPIQTTGMTALARSYPSPITPGSSAHPAHIPVAQTQLAPPLPHTPNTPTFNIPGSMSQLQPCTPALSLP